jgi:6-phosphofructokinase 1
MPNREDTQVENLGPAEYESPLGTEEPVEFVADTTRVRYGITTGPDVPRHDDVTFECAGPRARLFFDPAKTTAAIVTCSGLSPGLNTVIRSGF